MPWLPHLKIPMASCKWHPSPHKTKIFIPANTFRVWINLCLKFSFKQSVKAQVYNLSHRKAKAWGLLRVRQSGLNSAFQARLGYNVNFVSIVIIKVIIIVIISFNISKTSVNVLIVERPLMINCWLIKSTFRLTSIIENLYNGKEKVTDSLIYH